MTVAELLSRLTSLPLDLPVEVEGAGWESEPAEPTRVEVISRYPWCGSSKKCGRERFTSTGRPTEALNHHHRETLVAIS